MYCTNCGKELINGETFCPSCGKKQNESKITVTINHENKKNLYAFYIASATTPLLFIIRMLNQTSKHIPAGVNGSWKSHDISIVPGNIQAIMILLLIASTFLNIHLRKNADTSNADKIGITKIMLAVNILLGFIITFGKF